MNFPSTEQIHTCSHMWFIGHCHDTARNLGQVVQPWSPHNPGTNGIIRKEKATLTFSINYYYPTSAKDLKRGLKRISAKVWTLAGYQPREINNINTNKNNYGSIDMWTLTRLNFSYLLWSVVPRLSKILRASSSWSTLRFSTWWRSRCFCGLKES